MYNSKQTVSCLSQLCRIVRRIQNIFQSLQNKLNDVYVIFLFSYHEKNGGGGALIMLIMAKR